MGRSGKCHRSYASPYSEGGLEMFLSSYNKYTSAGGSVRWVER